MAKEHKHDEYISQGNVTPCAGCGALVYRGNAVVATQWGAKKQDFCGRCKPPYTRIETHAFAPYSPSGMVELEKPRYFKEFEVDEHGKLLEEPMNTQQSRDT